ncbi:MAG: UDP-N,N'-diacetylbacillosamine 2-epimerase (hydrolyzing) [Phycisphaerae bacterium]|nr:UDP-N,N'-diacetylbacillosamine 2-epimerase (hydrolyzing) [Phycisphaerae bacterium]
MVTGTRAEYGLLRSTLRAIREHPKLEPRLIATGAHLLGKFGRTIRDIEADGFRIDARIPMQRGRDDALDAAEGVARGVRGIGRFLVREDCDVVLVLGDRIEAFAGAVAGVTTGRCVAHVHGGDRAPGDMDDALRHAITKLAHVHFPATRQSAQRIFKLGEARNRVFLVGAPGLDELYDAVRMRRGRRGRSGEALIVQHPSGRGAREERRAAEAVLDAARACGLRRTIVYPNSDRGHDGVIDAIRRHVALSPSGEVAVHRSMPRDDFAAALARADVLIGNSSSGIIEAPYVGTPSVNVGERQNGREPGGRSVLNCQERREALVSAIHRALALRTRPGAKTSYGDGRASRRIADRLAVLDLRSRSCLHKLNTY